jgi:hypothetical protein
MHFDGDGRGFDADLGAAVDDGEGHARSLKEVAASCGFSRVDEVGKSEAGRFYRTYPEQKVEQMWEGASPFPH